MKNQIVVEVKAVDPEVQSLKNIAISKMKLLDRLKEDRKTAKDMLNDELESDSAYSRAQSAFEDAKKDRDAIKATIMMTSHAHDLKTKLNDISEEYTEIKKDLSDYLIAYKDKTKQLSFFDDMGNTIEIEQSAKPRVITKI